MADAATDAGWAAARWESIRARPLTVGLFYDEDGAEHEFVSGERGSQRAAEVLREVEAPVSPIGTYPAATHVEIKAAVAMRDGDGVETGVIVINHRGGPCPGDLGCSRALPFALPMGATLVVWWPTDQGMRSRRFTGRSA